MHIKDLKEHYVAGYGKQANPKISILNPNVTTLHLNTGEESRVLVVDVDEPDTPYAYAVRDKMRRNDFIVYSSQYTLNDVFNGKCKFKVFYEYHGVRLPRKKKNKAVEILYGKNNLAGFAGKRGDGYEYVISSLSENEIKPLHFDINDVVEHKVEKFDLFAGKEKLEKKKEKEEEKKEEAKKTDHVADDHDVLGHEKVDIKEFQNLLQEVGTNIDELPEMVKKGDILTFPCLFRSVHNDKKNANAYAFKKDGFYIAKCHGQICNQEYWELNKELKEAVLNRMHFENSKGFGEFDEKTILFKAPTGWGKTEAIAEEALKAINTREKTLILLQNKEAIVRLSDRINHKSNGAFESLYQMGKIYIYTSENKSQEHEMAVERADVIISHHYYFANAGNILTYFKDSMSILEQDDLKVIIDEAHTYTELATRLDLEVGGLYKRDSFAGMELWTSNQKALTADDIQGDDDYQIITECLDATVNDFHSVELQKQWKVYPQVDYLDVVSEIENHPNYTKMNEFQEDEVHYDVYINRDVKEVKENSLENENEGLHLLTDSAERVIIAKSQGDELKRKQLGRITFTAFHTQILKRVLQKPRQVILTTATWEDYHNDIVTAITPLHKEEVVEKIGKIGKIILLRASERKPARIRKKVLETTNDVNAKALLFFPTIAKAREVAKEYENIMLNDNGMYAIGKRKSSLDYVDNFVRNVTVAGLESSVAKGYNYLEEVEDNGSNGFELLYFDKKPVSPVVIKKYFDKDGNLKDYQSDYKWSAFAQAIGRAFRKSKDTLCVAINDINEADYKIIRNYLAEETNAEIIEDELNIMNIKISIPSFIQSVGFDSIKDQLKDNRLFKRVYLKNKKDENTS